MSALKLYTDEDVTDLLARTLRGRGFDIVSVHETDKRGITDAEQLELAICRNAPWLLSMWEILCACIMSILQPGKHILVSL